MGVAGTVTAPGPNHDGRQPQPHPRAGGLSTARRALRGIAGVLAGGLTVLALVLLAGFALARVERSPGPGLGMLVGHALAAAAAVILAVVADRRQDSRGSLAAGAVVLLAAVVLGVYWWA